MSRPALCVGAFGALELRALDPDPIAAGLDLTRQARSAPRSHPMSDDELSPAWGDGDDPIAAQLSAPHKDNASAAGIASTLSQSHHEQPQEVRMATPAESLFTENPTPTGVR